MYKCKRESRFISEKVTIITLLILFLLMVLRTLTWSFIWQSRLHHHSHTSSLTIHLSEHVLVLLYQILILLLQFYHLFFHTLHLRHNLWGDCSGLWYIHYRSGCIFCIPKITFTKMIMEKFINQTEKSIIIVFSKKWVF